MSNQKLVTMANDIATFFRAEAQREEAIAGIVNHLSKFWTPRMRAKLLQQLKEPHCGLNELSLEATRRLARQAA
jgi:formate dehydrogenase subunit delta